MIAQINNVFDSHYYTAAQLQGRDSRHRELHRSAASAVGGEFPVLQATFLCAGGAGDLLDWHGWRLPDL